MPSELETGFLLDRQWLWLRGERERTEVAHPDWRGSVILCSDFDRRVPETQAQHV